MADWRTKLMGAGAVALALALWAGPSTAWAQGAWSAPADARAHKNPVSGVGSGPSLAAANCVSCHGALGKGDGPAAQGLTPKPADWTSPAVQGQSDGELHWKITNGRGPMPPWRQLPDKQRWELVNYIRTMKK